jgi:hypothetical protein
MVKKPPEIRWLDKAVDIRRSAPKKSQKILAANRFLEREACIQSQERDMSDPILQLLPNEGGLSNFWPVGVEKRCVVFTQLAADASYFVAYGVDLGAQQLAFKVQGTIAEQFESFMRQVSAEGAVVIDLRDTPHGPVSPVRELEQPHNSPATCPPGDSILTTTAGLMFTRSAA